MILEIDLPPGNPSSKQDGLFDRWVFELSPTPPHFKENRMSH